jgi:predicted RNA binding protein YcfA (HicA-like mRNA interferase family)
MNPNNVSLKDFIRFLESYGCKEIRHTKGHYKYSHSKATRPITFQDHIDPVPLMVIKTNLKTLGLTLDDVRKFLVKN